MKRNNFRGPQIEKEIGCSCGGKAKLGSRKNYPFGRNSDSIRTKFYKCKSCEKIMILGNEPSKKGR